MLKISFKILYVFVCIAVLSPNESFGASQQQIRVLIYESNNLSFKGDKEKTFLVKGIGSGWKARGSLQIKIEKGKLKYSKKADASKWVNLKNDSKIIIKTRDPRGIWISGRRYGGEFRIVNTGSNLRVINHLSLDKYLKSVVASEMPKSWPMEALKAQAVAARTYALNQIKDNNYYDLDSNISNQVYLGLESETTRTRKAVSYTKNLVLVYKGRLIDAVFHSSSGGKTEDSRFVWGRYNPYLVSVIDYDKDSPHLSWEKKISNESLENIFSKIGGLNAIRVLEKTDTKRIKKVKIYGPKGHLFLTGKELRNVLGLKSTLIKFKMVSKPLLLSNRKNMFNNYINTAKKSDLIKTIKPRNILSLDNLEELPTLPQNDYLLVKGSGSGHGVGMSQWGAKGLAEKGASFRRILGHFYKGAKVSKFN